MPSIPVPPGTGKAGTTLDSAIPDVSAGPAVPEKNRIEKWNSTHFLAEFQNKKLPDLNRIKSGNKPGISTVRGYNAPYFAGVAHCFMSFALMHRDIGDRKDRNQNGIFYDIFPVELARHHDEIMSLLLQSALILSLIHI